MKNFNFLFRVKNLLALVCLLSLSFVTVSCSEDDPPRISLSTQELVFDFKAASKPVRVETDLSWKAEIYPAEAAEWCSLSLDASDRSESIEVHVEANLPEEGVAAERHATIVFTIGGKGGNPSATLHVSQGIMPEQN